MKVIVEMKMKQHNTLRKTYDEFLDELSRAFQQGDNDSKKIVEKMAPHMAKTLKETTLPNKAKGQQ